MQPPDELMTQVFLPSMRQLVAARLRSKGLSQSKISALLGMTQASVSLYLSTDPKKAYSSLSSFSIPGPDADRYAADLSSAVLKGPVEGVRVLTSIWTGLLGSGSVCPAHRALYPALSDCDVCIKEYGQRRGSRTRAISEVAEAVRMLEGSSKFAPVMPEVSVNIAYAPDGASAPADVVAVPGRITKVKGRARAMLPPEAGASVHMARVLLLAMTRRPLFRACINLLYDARMAGAMKEVGLRVLSVGGYPSPGSDDPTVDALERRLKVTPGEFDAFVDRGGSGIEPNVYVFAPGPREAARLALRLAQAYSSN